MYNFGNPNPFPGTKYKDFEITEQPTVPNGWYVAKGYGFYKDNKMPKPADPMLLSTNIDAYGNSEYFRNADLHAYSQCPIGYWAPFADFFQEIMGYEPSFNGYNGILINNLFIPACNGYEWERYGRYWCSGFYNPTAVDGNALFFYDGLSKQSYGKGNDLFPIRAVCKKTY